jgi:anti-anti-sigma factor
MEFYYDATDTDVLILSADGGLLSESAGRFVGELERYIELGVRKPIVDCSRLKRISSYGVGVLVSPHGRLAKRGGDVKLASVSGIVGKVIHITGLGKTFEIYPTVEGARQAFAAQTGATLDAADTLESRHPHPDS